MKYFFFLTVLISLNVFYGYATYLHTHVHKSYSNHIHKTLYIDRNFDDDEIIDITAAALEWSEQTQHVIDFDIVIFYDNSTFYLMKNGFKVQESRSSNIFFSIL